MSAKSAHQRWHEWRLRVVANSDQHENVKQRQRVQKRKERAFFKEKASNTQLEAKRAADRERQRRRRARLKAAKMNAAAAAAAATGVGVGGAAGVAGLAGLGQGMMRAPSSKELMAAALTNNALLDSYQALVSKQRFSQQPRHTSNARPSAGGSPMKIKVTGLISNRSPKKNGDHHHGRSNGSAESRHHIHVHTTAKQENHKSGAKPNGLNMYATSQLLRAHEMRNNQLARSPLPASTSIYTAPEQEQPLCLTKSMDIGHMTNPTAGRVDSGLEKAANSSARLLNNNSKSVLSCDVDQKPAGRKRSRKQSVPLKYVALYLIKSTHT